MPPRNAAADHDYDIAIVGGGLVGASLACALASLPFRVVVIEAAPLAPGAPEQNLPPSFDARALALSHGSRRILDGLGLWPAVAPHATPIEHIHVSDRGHFGFTRLSARKQGVDALGYVVEARDLGRALIPCLRERPSLQFLAPARVQALHSAERDVEIVLEGDARDIPKRLRARLVIGADGGNSGVRATLKISTRRRDYEHSAVITTVQPGQPHHNVAYERFTDSGPLALLPLQDNRCSVVWTVANGDVDALIALKDEDLLNRLQQRFGGRLGRFQRVGRRHVYPLVQVMARPDNDRRTLLIGNAAHSLHPIAGQGFNLGLRDVAALAEVLTQAARGGIDPGSTEVLRTYQAQRSPDQDRTALFTDTLARLYINPLPPVRLLRNLGLVGLDLCPPAKDILARAAMGLVGARSRLARGLPLETK